MKSFNDCKVGDKIYVIQAYNLDWNDYPTADCKKITSIQGDYARLTIRLDYVFAYIEPKPLSYRFKHNNWLFFADKEDFKNFINDSLDAQSLIMQHLIEFANKIDLL